MTIDALASNIEKMLHRIAPERPGSGPDLLVTAASGDTERLANALWALVREGKGALVGHERAVLAMLTPGTFDAHDFLSLLRQLKGANLFWFEHWTDNADGLAYHGWSIELELMLGELLARTTDRTVLEWADVSEPAGSSLLFALARHGIVEAHALPPDALPRFGRAFFMGGSWSLIQFAGWERVWDRATFARAAFACLADMQHVGASRKTLAPLVEFATPAQLALLVEKMLSPDSRTIDWLVARGKAIVPHLEVRLDKQLRNAKRGEWLDGEMCWHVGALARIRGQNRQPWPAQWLPLAKAMLKQDTPGLHDVLRIMDPQTRENLLVELVADKENWNYKLWPLMVFPTARLVERLVELIHKTRKGGDGNDYREPLFKALGKMGTLGQAALERMLDEPNQTEGVLANLKPTKANISKTLHYLGSSDITIRTHAEDCWLAIGNDERIELLEQHFEVLSPGFIARQLGYTQFHLRAAELAARLPDTNETSAWRRLCLHPPEILRPVMEEMAKTPQEAIERVRKAFSGSAFDVVEDFHDALERRRKGLVSEFDEDIGADGEPKTVDETIQAFRAEDLPAILHVTACRMKHCEHLVWVLCDHFGPLRPEIPWIAAFWWGIDRGRAFMLAADALGEALLPALHARAASNTIATEEWGDVLQVFAQLDPVGGFGYFARFAEIGWMRWIVQSCVMAAIENGSQEARDWLGQALSGKTREFALHFLSEYAVPEAVPALQALEKQKLSAKHKKLLQAALEAQKTRGAMVLPSNKILSARTIHKMDGAIESLRVSSDGQTMLAHAAGMVNVWQENREATIRNLENVRVELSLEGRFVLVMDEHTVKVFNPWENVDEPRLTLRPDKGLTRVVPLPGGRAFTLCAAQDAHHPFILWNLETGTQQVHKLNGLPAQVALIDDQRYVVATTDEKMTIRQLDGGKVIGKLQSWANYDGGGICALATGNGGKLVAVLFFDGSLMIWDISGSKIKALGRHSRIAPHALVTDPGSSWVVTPGTSEVLTWRAGQPARELASSGPQPVCQAEPLEDGAGGEGHQRRSEATNAQRGGMAVFVRPNVVAVGGQSINVWDLETHQHLGTWDKPVTTMISALGKLFVGDTEGNIWEVDVA